MIVCFRNIVKFTTLIFINTEMFYNGGVLYRKAITHNLLQGTNQIDKCRDANFDVDDYNDRGCMLPFESLLDFLCR